MKIMSSYAMTIDMYQRQQKNRLEPVTIINRQQKTLNSNFQIPGLKQPIKKEQKETEVFADHDDDYEYTPQEHKGGSWRSAFHN